MTGSKVLITVLGGDGERDELRLVDVVSYRESNWLVPRWCEQPAEGLKTPERIVCLDRLHPRKVNFGPTRFVVDKPIPKAVLYGDLPPELKDEYVVEL